MLVEEALLEDDEDVGTELLEEEVLIELIEDEYTELELLEEGLVELELLDDDGCTELEDIWLLDGAAEEDVE